MTKIRYLLPLMLLCIGIAVTAPGVAGALNSNFSPVVEALTGEAVIQSGAGETEKAAAVGALINPYDTIQTDEKAKLLVTWNNNLQSSLGEVSSVFYSPDDNDAMRIEMLEGVVRTVRERATGEGPTDFLVRTPTAKIQPDSVYEPTDIIVEVYDPSTTTVTVLSGRVKVTNLTSNSNRIVDACRTVFVSSDQMGLDVSTSKPDLVANLIEVTTMPDTNMATSANACGVTELQATPSGSVGQAVTEPLYYVDETQFDDYSYPETEFQVTAPAASGEDWVVSSPLYGSLYVPVPADYGVVPEWAQGFAQYYFMQQVLNVNNTYITRIRAKQVQLNNLIFVSKRAGNLRVAARARQELRGLRRQERLTAGRVDRLRKRVRNLENSGPLQRHPKLTNIVSNELEQTKRGKNRRTIENFEANIEKNQLAQDRLGNVADRQTRRLRNRLAREADPAKKQALRNQLDQISDNARRGKIAIPADQESLKDATRQLAHAKDPTKREHVRERLLTELNKVAPESPQANVLNEDTLQALRRDIRQRKNAMAAPDDVEAKLSGIADTIKRHPELTAGVGAVTGAALLNRKRDRAPETPLLHSDGPTRGKRPDESPSNRDAVIGSPSGSPEQSASERREERRSNRLNRAGADLPRNMSREALMRRQAQDALSGSVSPSLSNDRADRRAARVEALRRMQMERRSLGAFPRGTSPSARQEVREGLRNQREALRNLPDSLRSQGQRQVEQSRRTLREGRDQMERLNARRRMENAARLQEQTSVNERRAAQQERRRFQERRMQGLRQAEGAQQSRSEGQAQRQAEQAQRQAQRAAHVQAQKQAQRQAQRSQQLQAQRQAEQAQIQAQRQAEQAQRQAQRAAQVQAQKQAQQAQRSQQLQAQRQAEQAQRQAQRSQQLQAQRQAQQAQRAAQIQAQRQAQVQAQRQAQQAAMQAQRQAQRAQQVQAQRTQQIQAQRQAQIQQREAQRAARQGRHKRK